MNVDQVPVISLSAFTTDGVEEAKNKTAADIRDACINAGFFYVTDHGVPAEVTKKAFSRSRQFFETLSHEQKDGYDATKNPLYRGYISEASGKHTCAASKQKAGHKDSKESFTLGAEISDEYKSPMHGENQWPDEKQHSQLEGWKVDMQEYWRHMLLLTAILGKVLARSLDLDEKFFEQYLQHPCAQMVLLRYTPSDKLGCGEHTDCGFLTILAQESFDMLPEDFIEGGPGSPEEDPGSPRPTLTEDVVMKKGALEVKHRDSDIGWVNAPPIQGAFIVNLGDMAQRWSNDVYKSTWHRVVNKTGRIRYSIPFFCNCDFETPVSCICKEGAKYEDTTAGEYILKRLGLMRLVTT